MRSALFAGLLSVSLLSGQQSGQQPKPVSVEREIAKNCIEGKRFPNVSYAPLTQEQQRPGFAACNARVRNSDLSETLVRALVPLKNGAPDYASPNAQIAITLPQASKTLYLRDSTSGVTVQYAVNVTTTLLGPLDGSINPASAIRANLLVDDPKFQAAITRNVSFDVKASYMRNISTIAAAYNVKQQ